MADAVGNARGKRGIFPAEEVQAYITRRLLKQARGQTGVSSVQAGVLDKRGKDGKYNAVKELLQHERADKKAQCTHKPGQQPTVRFDAHGGQQGNGQNDAHSRRHPAGGNHRK